jgi:hypothetical protein
LTGGCLHRLCGRGGHPSAEKSNSPFLGHHIESRVLRLRQSAIALLDRRLCLLQAACRVFGLGLPVSPPHQVLLELQPRPAVVPIGEKHASVQIVQVRRGLHCGQGRTRRPEEAAHHRLPFGDQGSRFIQFAGPKQALGFPGEGRQFTDSLTVPGLRDRIGFGCRDRRRRRRAACQKESGNNYDQTHRL